MKSQTFLEDYAPTVYIDDDLWGRSVPQNVGPLTRGLV